MSDFVFRREMHPPECQCEWCHAYERLMAEYEAKRVEKARKRGAQILAMVDRSDPDGCWPWTGVVTPEGYGHVRWVGHSQLAHRVIYELEVGDIPDGMQIDHKCRNRVCVRPDHLQVATSKENNENRSPSSTGSSGLRNVSWHKRNQRWIVSVRHHGRTYTGGSFTDKDEAGRAAVALRNKLFTNNLADRD